jgi:uncharacterized protein (DUF169 family)
MNRLRALEEKTGGCWTGIKFHYDGVPEGARLKQPMRFCEAVAESRTRPIILTPEVVECPGARRSFGWATDGDEALAAAMAEKAGIPPDVAKGLIFGIPSLRAAPVAVTVGAHDAPDVALSYAQSEAAMNLLRRWQAVSGKTLLAEISSVMAVCGSVAVRAHLTGQLCLSFGCPDSRKYGAIGRDRLVAGMPMSLAEELAG